MLSGWQTARLSESLARAAEKKFGSRFSSLEELLEFVLQELLDESAVQMDQADEQMIEQRLRDLGYV